MADSSLRAVVEAYVRDIWMPQHFGERFEAKKARLCDGGLFCFDAVSESGTIACICTNAGKTISKGNATPKLMKVRSDILFMLRAPANRRLVILTCKDMFHLCNLQKQKGRMPQEIEFYLAPIEEEMTNCLLEQHRIGAAEMGR